MTEPHISERLRGETMPFRDLRTTRRNELLYEAASRIEKLEAALRVYAEEDHWFGDKFEPITFPEGECVCCYEHFSDQGEIARKALEGKGG